jgi:hypothetical protein
MPVVDLVPPRQRWCCNECGMTVETAHQGLNTPLHPCPQHAGFRIPLVPHTSPDRVRLVEREDYLNGDDVPVDDNGTPFMRAEVDRQDGRTDVFVYAPTAYATAR